MSDQKKAEVWNIITEYRAIYAKASQKQAPQFLVSCGTVHECRMLARYLIEEQKMKASSVRIAWRQVSIYQYDGTFGLFEIGDPDIEVLIATKGCAARRDLVTQPLWIYYSSYSHCVKADLREWCHVTMRMANLGRSCGSITLIDFRNKDNCSLARSIVKLFPMAFGSQSSEHRIDNTAIRAKVKALEASAL
jgi:hypothetical protein